MKRTITTIIIIAGIAVMALTGILIYFKLTPREDKIEVADGRINQIETMVRLCSMEIYTEAPVHDTINNKVIFAIQKQRGSISFDIEKLAVDTTGDTIRITLPPEIVEISESTDKNSWEVIDTKAIGPLAIFHSDKLTIEEENALKNRARTRAAARLYANGTIKKARQEAADNLRRLAETLYRRPAAVATP